MKGPGPVARTDRVAALPALIGLLLLVLPTFPARATGAAADPPGVHVEVVLEEASGTEVEGVLVAHPSDADAGESMRVPFRGTGTVWLPLEGSVLWRLEVEADGLWSASRVLVAERGKAMVVRLHPTGRVVGRLALPRGTEPPERLDLAFEPPPPASSGASATAVPREDLRGRVICPVAADLTWGCQVPAGRHELHLHAPGFASVFRWDVPIKATTQTSLGVLTLEPGASLVGFVDLAAPLPDGAEVEVELAPAQPSGALHRTRRLEALVRRTEPGPQGLFQFTDLRAGTYRLEARAEGLAPAVVDRLEVMPSRESRLSQPLVLTPFASLEVRLQPSLPPEGEHWHLVLDQPGESLERLEGTAAPNGTWRQGELRPGFYRLQVEDEHGSRWHRQELEVKPLAPPVEISLPLLAVEGRVTLGGEPVRARLTFGGIQATGSVAMISDPEGRFRGHLPYGGTWPLSVLLERGGAEQTQPRVSVTASSDGAPAWLEIDLPDTRVKGRVVDAGGRPVRHVRIRVWRSGSSPQEGLSQVTADEGGAFELRALPEGEYDLDAFSGSGSGRARVRVREGEPVEDLRLTLLGEAPLLGRVVSEGRPVAGAEIHAYPVLPAYRAVPLARGVTGPDGDFEVDVPMDALQVDLLVLPPGHAARLLRVPFEPEAGGFGGGSRGLVIEVHRLGGTLFILSGGDERDYRSATLGFGDATMFLEPFRRWALLHGARPSPTSGWVLPNLAPGSYRLCNRNGMACREGILPPGGLLELEVVGTSSRPPDP